MRTTKQKQEDRHTLDIASGILATIRREGRTATTDEQVMLHTAERIVGDVELDQKMRRVGAAMGDGYPQRLGSGSGGGGIRPSDFIEDPLVGASEIPREIVFGASSPLIDNADDAGPRRVGGIVPQRVDSRFLFANLAPIDPQEATSIQTLVSTGRSLDADVADLASTGEKHVSSSGTTLSTITMQRVATVSDYYPNSIAALPAFRSLSDLDMTLAIRFGLDAYVIDELVSGAGTTSGDSSGLFVPMNGGGILMGQIRRAQKVIQDAGFMPDLVAISSTDAENLDLSVDDNNQFLLSPSPRDNAESPLWAMKVVVAAGLEAPIVLDRSGVEFYLGNVLFSSDPYSQFSTNQSRYRLEAATLLVVRQPDAVYVIEEAS